MQNKKLLTVALATVCWVGCSGRPQPNIQTEYDANGRVTSMSFIGSNVTDDDLGQLSKNTDLQELRLQECNKVSDKGLEAIKSCSKSLKKLELLRVPISDDGLASLESLDSLEELNLAHTKVTGKGLRYLAKTPLTKLTIHSRVVTPEALASLADLSKLKDLELQCQDIAIKDLPALGQIKQLERLVAFRTPLGQDGLNVLQGLDRLKVLILNSPDITDDSVAALNTLRALEEIEFSNSTITAAGIGALQLPKLKKFSLDGSKKVTDGALGNFQGMPNLETLMLGGTSVSGVDLSPLANLPNLKEVLLMGNQFKGNDETIKALKALLPHCEVNIMRG